MGDLFEYVYAVYVLSLTPNGNGGEGDNDSVTHYRGKYAGYAHLKRACKTKVYDKQLYAFSLRFVLSEWKDNVLITLRTRYTKNYSPLTGIETWNHFICSLCQSLVLFFINVTNIIKSIFTIRLNSIIICEYTFQLCCSLSTIINTLDCLPWCLLVAFALKLRRFVGT